MGLFGTDFGTKSCRTTRVATASPGQIELGLAPMLNSGRAGRVAN